MAIKLSPDQLQDLATRLDRAKEASLELAAEVKGLINEATGNWEGKAKERYLRDYEEIEPALKEKLPSTLETLSTNMKTMAKEFANLDSSFG